MGINVTYPLLFLLLIPCGFLIYAYVLRSRKRKNRAETTLVATIRSCIFFLLVFALTVPHWSLPVKGSNVVFLVDRSASVKDTGTKTLAWIEESMEAMGSDDSFAVAAFGQSAIAEQAMTTKHVPISQYSGEVKEGASRLDSGIQFASSLIPSYSSGRIVLFTDGNETSGSSVEEAKLLKKNNIELDVVPLSGMSGEDMALKNVTIPPSIYQGEKTEIALEVYSNAAKKATVRISLNNQEIIKKTVEVREGTQSFSFSHIAKQTGLQVYQAEIIAENDTFTENNQLQAITNVKGTPKVLIVEGGPIGEIGEILNDSGLIVESTVPEKLPTTLAGFLQYQSIVFNNVPATSISKSQMKMIEQSVKEFGNGFVMLGGENSFGLGGYFKTPIEALLPIDMDIKGKKEMPSLGLIMVLDRSGSMSGNKLSLAKEAAARSVELLREQDTFGFIAFDDRPWEIVKARPLKDKDKVVEKIRTVPSGGGTEIYHSLEMAYERLMEAKLQRKHIILLTDGQSNSVNDYEGLIEEGKEKNVTLSTVSIGSDADQDLLEELSEFGTGRFYDVTDASVIPSILSRETVMASRTYIEDNPFYPSIGNSPNWNPLFKDGVPKMNAYIATTAKRQANLSLTSDKDDPVLAEWQYGMGNTAAFTSDISGKWSGDWPAWSEWGTFVNQLITNTLPKYESEPYVITQDNSGEETVLKLESSARNHLPVSVSVLTEKGEKVEVGTKLIAPGKHEVIMPKQPGMYFLSVEQGTKDGERDLFQTGFTIPYSEEYSMQGQNKKLLQELLTVSGGVQLQKESEAFRPLRTTAREERSISSGLLLAAFLLLFVEIALRRFGLHRFSHAFLTKRKVPARKNESVATLNKVRHAPGKKEKVMDRQIDIKQEKEPEKSKPLIRNSKEPSNKLSQTEREEQMKRLIEARKRKK